MTTVFTDFINRNNLERLRKMAEANSIDSGRTIQSILPDQSDVHSEGYVFTLDTSQPDMVNHPPHYNTSSVECIEAIRAALTEEEFRGFCKGNAIKYVWREKNKAGAIDLSKATWYLNYLSEKGIA